MGLPKYRGEEHVIDYHSSVRELKLRKIEEGLSNIGFDEKFTRKIAQIILVVKGLLGKI